MPSLRNHRRVRVGFLRAVCLLFLCAPLVHGQSDIGVSVSLSRDTIGLDEHAILEVNVSGSTQDLPKPQMPTLTMFEVYSQGQSSSLSIAGGQIESSVTYRYLVMPREPGTYPIRNIAVVYRNKRYKGNAVTLTVLDKGSSVPEELEQQALDSEGESKDCFLETVVDNREPYVNEQVTLTLKFYIAVKYYSSPELAEPTTTGFWTEVLGNKAPYFQKVGNRTYKVIERKYALFPTQTGELIIGRASITATVASRRSRRRDPFDVFGMLGRGENVTVRSQPIRIKVRALPDKSRPADYTGTIGEFSIEAVANKTEVEINQPVSVRINISGVGNVKSVAEPKIPDLPDFRVYRASSSENVSKVRDKIGGTKTFEEVFIPKRSGTLEIPSLSFNFFDPKKRTYKTVRTRPIRLNVHKPEGYTDVPGTPYSGPDITLGAESRDIRFIKDNPGDLRPRGKLLIANPVYIVVNALPVLLLLGTVMARLRREKLSTDIGYARAKAASKLARRRLGRAKQLAAEATATEFYAESNQAVLSYVADKLNISAHGLTSEKVAQLLAERSADPRLIDDTVRFLNQCSFARYAPASSAQADINRALATAESLMVRMEGIRF